MAERWKHGKRKASNYFFTNKYDKKTVPSIGRNTQLKYVYVKKKIKTIESLERKTILSTIEKNAMNVRRNLQNQSTFAFCDIVPRCFVK